MFGFLGPNGAGKTTTIRTLLDLLHPTARDGAALRPRQPPRQRRDPRPARQPPRRLRLRHARRRAARRCTCWRACAASTGIGRAEELAERFRADLDRPLGQLSRGNRQKVGLILATFHRPELLILDEPTSGLDPLMQEEFLALVAEERERGCAVFLSSHELDEVQRVCDRVGIVRGGRLIAVERIADLLGKARRRFSAELGDPAGIERLRTLPGVADLEVAATASPSSPPATSTRCRELAATTSSTSRRPTLARGGLPRLLRGGGGA